MGGGGKNSKYRYGVTDLFCIKQTHLSREREVSSSPVTLGGR